ncbi:hypothetical protein T06_7351, partial [Trichinella sp. T6]
MVYSPSILQKHAARHFIGLKFHWFSCRLNFISCCFDETVTEIGSPLMYFKKYFTDEMFQYIADQSTTTYAVQNNNLRVHFSRHNIELFISDWSANFRVDSITNRLTRNCFIETMRYLHFNDNLKTIVDRDDPDYDRLWVYSP